MIKTFSTETLDALKRGAVAAARRRTHLNIHAAPEAPVQRLFIALEPDTYIRPHRHPQANKWELFVLLEGALDVLVFADDGAISQRIALSGTAHRAVEIPPNTWHSVICRGPALALEIKEGPYVPTAGEDFAVWAPAENSAGVTGYLRNLATL